MSRARPAPPCRKGALRRVAEVEKWREKRGNLGKNGGSRGKKGKFWEIGEKEGKFGGEGGGLGGKMRKRNNKWLTLLLGKR